MKTLFWMMGVLVVVGCGRGLSPGQAVVSDPAFAPYLSQYDQAAISYGSPPASGRVSIQFGEVVEGEAGLCHPATLVSAPYITINTNAWMQMTDSEKATLIFHELGHCILNQSHRADSIMSGTILPGFTFYESRASYEAELFRYDP